MSQERIIQPGENYPPISNNPVSLSLSHGNCLHECMTSYFFIRGSFIFSHISLGSIEKRLGRLAGIVSEFCHRPICLQIPTRGSHPVDGSVGDPPPGRGEQLRRDPSPPPSHTGDLKNLHLPPSEEEEGPKGRGPFRVVRRREGGRGQRRRRRRRRWVAWRTGHLNVWEEDILHATFQVSWSPMSEGLVKVLCFAGLALARPGHRRRRR